MVRIMVDSGCDLTQREARELKIELLPITVTFGETEYQDGVSLPPREFYEKLIESDELPHTSQISPYVYGEYFKKFTGAGDTVVCLTLSSKLSGSYQSALMAAEDYEGVFVVDTLNVCVGEQILARLAARLRDAGTDAAGIAAELEKARGRVQILGLLDTLEYLKRGGRISSAVAFAGEALGIKPVVSVVDGEVAMVGKARGSRNGSNLLRKLIEKTGGINFDMPYAISYTGLSDDILKKYLQDSADLYEGHIRELPISAIGATIGTHVGPNCICVAFFSRDTNT